MAALTPNLLTDLRNGCERGGIALTYTKPQVNAALQALEDWYETSGRQAAGAAIEVAAAGVFTNAQKKKLGKLWLQQKAGRE